MYKAQNSTVKKTIIIQTENEQKNMKRQFTENIKMANKYIKRCSTAIREM